MAVCASCNHPLAPETRYCAHCGTEVPRPIAADGLSASTPLAFSAPVTAPLPTHAEDQPGPFLPMDTPPRQPAIAPSPVPAYSPHPYPAQAMPPSTISNNINVNVATAPVVMIVNQAGPGFFVRAVYYLFVGWWAAGLAIALGYALALTVIGLPLALMIFNRLGTILTLRPYTQSLNVTSMGGATVVGIGTAQQQSFLVRTLYFLFVGWWWGAVWLAIAYSLCLLILTLPLGLWMMNRTGAAMTLYRY